MFKEIKAIASFGDNGRMAPIWVQISKNNIPYTYKVLDYTCLTTNTLWANEFKFICKVQGQDKKEQEMQIRYSVKFHIWKAEVNKSSWAALQ